MISQIFPVSDATLVHMEDRAEPPTQRRTQIVACLALLTYGFDPAEFEMDPDDIGMDPEMVKRAQKLLSPNTRSEQGKSRSRCLTKEAA